MSTSKARLGGVLIPLAVWTLSVPVADGAFRLAGDRPSRDLQGLFVAVGDSGYKLGSNVHTWADFYTGRMDVYTDDLGLRCGPDRSSRTTRGDTVDVLFLGDSQGFGNLLNFDETIVGQIQRQAAGRQLRMANAGVGGHYLRNQLELAKWMHDKEQITIRKVVILLTPIMIQTAGRYNRVAVGSDGRLYSSKPSQLSKLALWAKTRTVVYSRIRGAFRQVVGLRGMVGRLVGTQRDDPVVVQLFATDKVNEREAALVQILEETRDWARSIGASVDLVYTPLAAELDFGSVQETARLVGATVDADTPFGLAKEAAAEVGIGFLDLRPALTTVRRARQPVTMEGDPHYGPAASAASAELIWSFLFPQQNPGPEEGR